MNHEKRLDEMDVRALQRLTFEISGYDVLIREFMQAKEEFNLDKEKWEELVSKRDRLICLRGEMIARLCDEGFSGAYEMDFSTGVLKWG